MTAAIPASEEVSSIPSVLAAGGNPLSPNAVFLTTDTSIPYGVAQPFPNTTAVGDWFGVNAPESAFAAAYFAGFNGCTALPGNLYFYQYNTAAVAGYLRGGALTNVTLTELQAFSGVLVVSINGEVVTSANINLAAATSFTNAAALITTGLQTVGGIFSGTCSTTTGSATLDVTAIASGTLHLGDVVVAAGVPVGTTITAVPAGGGVGNYTMSANATATNVGESVTVSSTAVCTYDAQRNAFVITSPTTGAASTLGFASGSLAADILLTAATGAVLSAGAAAASPAGAMNGVVASTQNWVSFTHVFDPDNGAPGGAVKLQFAAWTSQQSPAGNERFIYFAWDKDVIPGSEANDAASFGALVKAAAYNGTAITWEPGVTQTAGLKAAFCCGMTASLDTTATNGRITYKFKSQAGLIPDVTDATTAANLDGNGYNYYAAVATANQTFQYLRQGSMPGVWKWIDPYVNQILMNADFQLALLSYLTSVKSVPYVTIGYSALYSALQDPITKYLNFGAIRAGVPLSAAQVTQVNTAAGVAIDGILSSTGYYLQILPASAQSRGNRSSPPMTFWYTDGGSIHQINMASIDVQ